MDWDHRRIWFQNDRGEPIPRKPILRLVFPLLPCHPDTHGVFLPPQRRYENKRLGARSADHSALAISLRMSHLAHIHTYIDKTSAQGWANRGSVSTASSARLILQEISLASRRQQIHASDRRVPGEDNKMVDAVSRLTCLQDRHFLFHLCTHFPQSKPWFLLPLSSL